MATSEQVHLAALFHLVPLNTAAAAVVADPRNRQFVSAVDGTDGLDVGIVPSAIRDGITLATMGRAGDIHLASPNAGRIQCAFEVELATKAVMLHDRSANQSTQVHDDDGAGSSQVVSRLVSFEYDRRPRRVVVRQGINPVLGMCGRGRDKLLFRFLWNRRIDKALDAKLAQRTIGIATHPEHAGTVDDTGIMGTTEAVPGAAGAAGAGRVTRMCTLLGEKRPNVRYDLLEELGHGNFSVVHKALDLDTGCFIAVKLVQRAPHTAADMVWNTLKREVQNLTCIKHRHIVDFIWAQNCLTPRPEIILSLKDGSLAGLVSDHRQQSQNQNPSASLPDDLCTKMFFHMLQALDFLASRNLIHRDVKPGNILYTRADGAADADAYTFCLADFGVTNSAYMASTYAGTRVFMAPEIARRDALQTSKADVWSLCVTVLSVRNEGGFADKVNSQELQTSGDIEAAVLRLAADLTPLQPMAVVDPARRASAAQMLCAVFQGDGLTTPRSQVAPLDVTPLDEAT